MLDVDELRGLRKDVFIRSGIYFLWVGDEIVYIGQSVDMHSRVSAHLNQSTPNRMLRGLTITGCTFIDCKPEELDVLESIYISAYLPKCNFRRGISGPTRRTTDK